MKTKWAGLFIVAVAGILWFNVTTVKAQQNNFQIAPPPIPYPYFEPGRMDFKMTGTYMSLKGDAFKFSGAGFDGSIRKAFDEKLALDGQFAFFAGGGEMDFGIYSVKPTLIAFTFGGNLEFQFFKNPGGSMIGYIGMNMPISIISFDKYWYITWYGSKRAITPSRITTVMIGMPIGIQGGINLGENWKLAPFFSLIPYLGGTATLSYDATPIFGAPTSVSIDSFMTTSFGTDIIYVPWNLSMGTILQQATSSGDNEDVKTVMIQLSWHWRK